jgi:hypothetical protein
MENIKIIRLQSGEDIIAEVIEDEESVMLVEPMTLIMKRTTQGSVMYLMPWLPTELIKDNCATLYQGDILAMFEPNDDMVEYFTNMVEKVNKKKVKETDLLNTINQFAEEFDVGSEEHYKKILTDTKLGTVH